MHRYLPVVCNLVFPDFELEIIGLNPQPIT